MPAIATSRTFAPYAGQGPADLVTRVAVSLSILSWLGVGIALFWR
ncbi:MAG: hypothetical protein MT490_16580 [Sphingomonas sp.]|nr:hypothetical protein [Sphingomonas sp.]MCX8477406.1 hypothetical protein [Sphingomonas sp.]